MKAKQYWGKKKSISKLALLAFLPYKLLFINACILLAPKTL